ncbi:MAG: regulatory protein RecX [Clostridia bacterium]
MIQASRDYQRALSYALRLISYRDYSEKRIRAKLEKRYTKEIIDKVILEMIDNRYIDEKRSIKNYLKDRMQYNLWGPYKIYRSLLNKGYKKELIKSELDKISNDEVLNYCKQALLNYCAKQNKDIEKDKLYRFLYGRGFPSDVIMRSLEQEGYLQ